MTLQEFDKAIDLHRRKWKRARYIAKIGRLSGHGLDAVIEYALYDRQGREMMRCKWTSSVAESLRNEFEWERAKLSRLTNAA